MTNDFITRTRKEDGLTIEEVGRVFDVPAPGLMARLTGRKVQVFMAHETTYKDEMGRLHNPNGPAYERSSPWKQIGDGFQSQPEEEKWAIYGVKHRDPKDGPAHTRWGYYGREEFFEYAVGGKAHRDPKDGPARVQSEWDSDFDRYYEAKTEYLVGGEHHRDPKDGPAQILERTGGERHETYYLAGQKVSKNPTAHERLAGQKFSEEWLSGPLPRPDGLIRMPSPDGSKIHEENWINGKMVPGPGGLIRMPEKGDAEPAKAEANAIKQADILSGHPKPLVIQDPPCRGGAASPLASLNRDPFSQDAPAKPGRTRSR